MIILGNKNSISTEDKEKLSRKLEQVHLIVLNGNPDEDIIDTIAEELKKNTISFLVLNLDKKLSLKIKSYLEGLNYEGLEIMLFADFSYKFLNKKYMEFNENNLDTFQAIEDKQVRQFSKRLFDFTFASCALVIIFPVISIIAILIKMKSPEGNVFFTQQRLGMNGHFFRVLKFRTMVPNAESKLQDMMKNMPEVKEEYLKYRKLKNDPRIIPGIGHFLRKTSLDELPQFINVFLGSMSIVGPRPYIEEEFVNHDKKYLDIILSVRPGVTGLWQVSERHNDTFDERVERDLEYITHQSFLGDLKIIFQTVFVMATGKGI